MTTTPDPRLEGLQARKKQLQGKLARLEKAKAPAKTVARSKKYLAGVESEISRLATSEAKKG